MMKNRMYSGIWLGALCLAIVSVLLFAQQGRTQGRKTDMVEHHALMQQCAKACSECQLACDGCASFCSHMLQDGKKEHLVTLTTCHDCATTCSAASQIVARRGPFSQIICAACAETCALCAAECKKFPDDKQMKSCAEECLRCAQVCNDMLKQMDTGR